MQKFNHPALGVGVLVGTEGDTHLSIKFKNHTIRFRRDDASLVSVSPDTPTPFENDAERRERSLENLKHLKPEELPVSDLSYLLSMKDFVTVRFSWPPFLDSTVRERFAELGREIPEDARPMNSGSRGGTPMYGLSCEIKVNGKEYLSKVSYGLALYTEHGFEITYAKK